MIKQTKNRGKPSKASATELTDEKLDVASGGAEQISYNFTNIKLFAPPPRS